MNKTNKVKSQPPPVSFEAITTSGDDAIRQLAFEHSLQANIITTVSTGRIIMANNAACQLLGYTEQEILSRTRSDIFSIEIIAFKKMLKQRTEEGQSKASITGIRKDGSLFACEVTSAVFKDKRNIEKAITTIVDMTESIGKQKEIDEQKEKKVADDIVVAETKQKKIDDKKEKKVAGDIVLAESKQKKIDEKKDKKVANDIMLVESKQKKIDARNEKKVAGDIIIAMNKADARLLENNEWIKYIAKASYDVMWDWDIKKEQIYVGESIKEVFGYEVADNTATLLDFFDCVLPNEKKRIEEKLHTALASRKKGWKDNFMFLRKDGSLATTASRASIVRDETGNAIRLIGAIQDISRLEELEKKLITDTAIQDKQSEYFQLAAKLSFDGIWDLDILTNEFFLGEGFEELFGYTFDKSADKAFEWAEHLHPDDKDAVKKGMEDAVLSGALQWESSYRFIRADGSIANVFGRATIMRHKDGQAYRMIGVIHDLSEQKDLEEKLDQEMERTKMLTESKESFRLIFNSSSDVLYDIDLVENKIVLSDAYEKVFGYTISGNMTPVTDWANHIHADDREEVIQDYFRMLATDDIEWKYTYRFLKADKSVTIVLSSAIILRNTDGNAYRMIGSMQDISKQRVLEKQLEQEILLKEKQIADATREAKEAERSDIGRELHDNVNQLLGASRLYVDMAKRGGENSAMYLNRSSEYTLSAIEEIRKLTKELTTDSIKNLGLCESIEGLADETMEMHPVKIIVELKFGEDSVNEKFKLNLYRIVQEHIHNILKHAKAVNVTVHLSQTARASILTISDDGIGFDTRKEYTGIGLINIKSRAAAYNGLADFASKPGKGCILTVTFPFEVKKPGA